MMDKIEKLFSGYTPNIIGVYKKSAVMILLVEEDGEPNIVFEVRAHNLRHQPGDVCLPGGRVEDKESPREAAVREVMEELNLSFEEIEYIGEMNYFVTPYNAIIYPFVAKCKNNNMQCNKSEVDHIFKVPISFLMANEPMLYELEIGPNLKEDFPYHLIRGGKEYKFGRGKLFEYFYSFNDYIIWGTTALIVKNFIDSVKKTTS